MSEAEAEDPDELSRAIGEAKKFLLKAFRGENIENLQLEEVKPPDFSGVWQVTLGFSRRRDYIEAGLASKLASNNFLSAAVAASVRPIRVYKVVNIDLRGNRLPSITNRKED